MSNLPPPLIAENHHRYLQVDSHIGSNQMQAGQNMSQAAQFVLLPAQIGPPDATAAGAVNVSVNGKQPLISQSHQEPQPQQQVQMILPTDVGYQIAFPNVGVLTTTILITDKNECIFIPQNSVPLETKATHPLYTAVDATFANVVEYSNNECRRQFTQEQECEFITLANTGTQTVIAGIPENEVMNQTTHTQLLNPQNCQILGIINTNQIGILQNESSAENQVLLIEATPEDHSVQMVSEPAAIADADQYDVNAFLASTLSSAVVEKSDPNQAKEWLKDSCIVNRALKALKKADQRSSPRSHSSNRQPGMSHQQQQYWRCNDRSKSSFTDG